MPRDDLKKFWDLFRAQIQVKSVTKLSNHMELLGDEINNLEESLKANPFTPAIYDRLISLLRIKKDYSSVFNIIKRKAGLIALTKDEIEQWVDDINTYSEKTENLQDNSSSLPLYQEEIDDLWNTVTQDYSTVDYWLRRLEAFQQFKSAEEFQTDIQLAIQLVLSDFKNGHKIWSFISDQFTDPSHKLDAYMERIRTPHAKLDDTYSELSSFISTNYPDQYDELMRKASQTHSKTQRRQRYIEPFEIKLRDEESKETWIEYLHSMAKFSSGNDFQQVETLFARFISDNKLLESHAIDVWLSYLEEVSKEDRELLETNLMLFVKFFPLNPTSFATFMRYALLLPDKKDVFEMITTRLELSGILENAVYEDWSSLVTTLLSERYKLVVEGHLDEMKTLFSETTRFFESALEHKGNMDNAVEKVCIRILGLLGELDLAKDMIVLILERFRSRSNLWLFAYNFFLTNKLDPREVLENSADFLQEMDNPYLVVAEWLQYEQLHGTVDDINDVLKKSMHLPKSSAKPPGDQESREMQETKTASQEKSIPKQNTVTRSRENFTVKVQNIPLDCQKNTIEDFFTDCGTIRSVIFYGKGATKHAIVEFSSEQEVATAITKTNKILDGKAVVVERHLEATLFVSNYPPSMLHEKVEELFAQFGIVVSVRFPHQKDNYKSRRFCYVEYEKSSLANDAIIALNGKEIKDEALGQTSTLKVAISRPVAKEDKHTPMAERKLRVVNLPREFDQAAIKKTFEDVEQVVIPKATKKRAEGQMNDGVAILVFPTVELANAALKMNGIVVANHTLEVSKQRQQEGGHVFEEIATMGLLNVDETLSAEQIKAIVSEKVGHVKHVEIFPSHRAALVEFSKAADAGRASLILQGTEIGKLKIDAVSKEQVTKTLKEVSQKPPAKRLMMPASVARKKRRA